MEDKLHRIYKKAKNKTLHKEIIKLDQHKIRIKSFPDGSIKFKIKSNGFFNRSPVEHHNVKILLEEDNVNFSEDEFIEYFKTWLENIN